MSLAVLFHHLVCKSVPLLLELQHCLREAGDLRRRRKRRGGEEKGGGEDEEEEEIMYM